MLSFRDVETILQNVQGALSQNGYEQHPQVRGLPELRQKPFLELLVSRSAPSTDNDGCRKHQS